VIWLRPTTRPYPLGHTRPPCLRTSGGQQGAILRHTNVPELAMGTVYCCWNRYLLLDRSGRRIDDHRLGGIAVAHDENAVLADRLNGVDLGAFRRVVMPKDFLIWTYHARPGHAGEKNIAIRQLRSVVKFLISPALRLQWHRVLPYDLAAADNKNRLLLRFPGIPLAGIEKRMLSGPPPWKHRR